MITAEGLSFSYRQGFPPVLNDLDFEVETGEIFGFLGPSGAGKSTTQRVLIKLLEGFGGRVEVLGRPLAAWGKEFFEQVGVSFELPNHFLKLTALENLHYFRSLYRVPTRDPVDVLDLVGLVQHGDKRVADYSKGMRVRLNLARALLHRPKLLFLDEPTSGLDPVNSSRVRDLVRQMRDEGATVFLTTHDMHVADSLCDRVAFIVDGRLACVDPPRTLKLRHGRPSVAVEFTSIRGLERREFPLDGLGENTEFQRLLKCDKIETIHSQETTLEQVFIDVTGRNLT